MWLKRTSILLVLLLLLSPCVVLAGTSMVTLTMEEWTTLTSNATKLERISNNLKLILMERDKLSAEHVSKLIELQTQVESLQSKLKEAQTLIDKSQMDLEKLTKSTDQLVISYEQLIKEMESKIRKLKVENIILKVLLVGFIVKSFK